MKTVVTMMAASVVTIQAAVLTGTGTHLPLPPIPHDTGYNHEAPTITTVSGGYTATWSSAVEAAWQGTFSGTGSHPTSGTSANTTMDFSGLPTNVLPIGSLLWFGDLDSSSNTVTLRAFDEFGNLMNEWLNETSAVYGVGRGPGNSIVLEDLPGWSWDAGSSSYFIDGGTVTGFNPTVNVYLESNQAITSLEVQKPGTSYNFGVRAPLSVPEPSSVLLSGMGLALGVMRRKRVS